MTRKLVAALVTSTCIVAIATPAAAQTREYNIPAGSLKAALDSYVRQSGRQVVYRADEVKKARSPGARGAQSADAALKALLAGTGYTTRIDGSLVAIVKGGNVQGASAPTNASSDNARFVDVPAASASTVVDARTGAALKGALVEIVETGETTSTGDLGEFRFPGKNGSFNLRISYLGYPKYEQFVDLLDGRATAGVLLSDGSATGEIVVTAYQSGRAQALNQERTADNTSTVISSDLLGQFDGTTISDALRRTPGVAFVADTATGDGTNVIIRGLSPDFNTVTLNGLRLPVGSGIGRSPSLNNILADSVSKITISKTLLPGQDGSGTGGLIDIQTKGPLDRPKRYFSISAEKAGAEKSFLNETYISGTASWKFGTNNDFGISLSAQYRKRRQDQIIVSSTPAYLGQFLPATDDGRPVFTLDDIDPRRQFPFEPAASELYPNNFSSSQNSSNIENLAISASAQWQIGTHSNLRLDVQRNRSRLDSYTRTLSLSSLNGYELLPVPEAGGETRPALIWENFGTNGLPMSIAQSYIINDGKTNTTTNVGLQGSTDLGPWEFDYKVGYALGKELTPNRFSLTLTRPGFPNLPLTRSDLTPEILENSLNGRLISPFSAISGGRISLPGLSESGFALVNDENRYRLSRTGILQSNGRNKRLTASFDVKRSFESQFIKYIQAGFFLEDSNTVSNAIGSLPSNQYRYSGALSNLGIAFSPGSLGRIGFDQDVDFVDPRSLYSFYEAVRDNPSPLLTKVINLVSPLLSEDSIEEKDLAAYLQTELNIGNLQIVGGFRAERVRTSTEVISGSTVVDIDGNFDESYFNSSAKIVSISATDTSILPRIMLNYRFNDRLILRLGYYRSLARPRLEDLQASTDFSLDQRLLYGPNRNQASLTILSGNPDLKAAATDNLDVSIEWYSENIGVIKAGAFYKPTKNAFFSVSNLTINQSPDNIPLPTDPRFSAPNLYVAYNRPANSDKIAKLWGFEISAERRLTFLPGMLQNFGLYGNFTYTTSARDERLGFRFSPNGVIVFEDTPYAQQPKRSGTVAITYSKSNVDGSISYTSQSGYQNSVPVFGAKSLVGSISSLDARFQYITKILGPEMRIYIEGSNLLKGFKSPNFSNYQDFESLNIRTPVFESYLGGRTVRAGISVTF